MGWGAVAYRCDRKAWSMVGRAPAAAENTCNIAEYRAFMMALKRLLRDGQQDEIVQLRGDSKLVVEQMSGRWRIKRGAYKPYALKAKLLVEQFSQLSIKWVPRERNVLADRLSKHYCQYAEPVDPPRLKPGDDIVMDVLNG
jgi:ribonuclease H / adenosylcobalamin/alpha-ribazole phosphatase